MKINDLKDCSEITTCKEIKKGWSADQKYYIETQNNRKFLLRAAPEQQAQRKSMEFQHMKTAYDLGVPMQEPLDIENNLTLLTWLEGNDAKDVLPKLSAAEQYQLGVTAGKILKTLHSIPAPAETENWDTSYARKIDRNINNYKTCPVKYPKGATILEYVQSNRNLITQRPLTFQHGDYHTGNMIFSADTQLNIIDFNRWSYGDPWEEFNRIDFTAELSPEFAAGQINGYFDNQPPVEFFQLLSLYICTNLLNALPWALDYSDKEVEVMLNKAAAVLEWFDDMEETVPSWYRNSKCF